MHRPSEARSSVKVEKTCAQKQPRCFPFRNLVSVVKEHQALLKPCPALGLRSPDLYIAVPRHEDLRKIRMICQSKPGTQAKRLAARYSLHEAERRTRPLISVSPPIFIRENRTQTHGLRRSRTFRRIDASCQLNTLDVVQRIRVQAFEWTRPQGWCQWKNRDGNSRTQMPSLPARVTGTRKNSHCPPCEPATKHAATEDNWLIRQPRPPNWHTAPDSDGQRQMLPNQASQSKSLLPPAGFVCKWLSASLFRERPYSWQGLHCRSQGCSLRAGSSTPSWSEITRRLRKTNRVGSGACFLGEGGTMGNDNLMQTPLLFGISNLRRQPEMRWYTHSLAAVEIDED